MTAINSTKEAIASAKTRMEKALDDFRKDLTTLRTGRANAALLDSVRVDYHGTPMPVNQLGSLTVPEPSMIVIAPWDTSVVPLIDKAIRTAELGLNPTNDGKVVRVPIPSLTEERRKDLVKQLHKVLENHRTALRNVRRDLKEAVEKLEKDKKISEDEKKRGLDELEKLSHAETKKMEDMSEAKEKEIMQVK
jgi:ribosome recycling factor